MRSTYLLTVLLVLVENYNYCNSMKFIAYFSSLCLFILAACEADKNYPGVEYAPQMYHSVPYEPLTQITEESRSKGILSRWYYKSNSILNNDFKGAKDINSRLPVKGTVARQEYSSLLKNQKGSYTKLLLYDLHKDSVQLAGRILENPLVKTEELLNEGKSLYLSFCSSCHGEGGAGDGKVGKVYQGVANLKGGAYINLSEGHIFHVITHGKGRMWSHRSQLSPEERWKVVAYVKKLQSEAN